MSSYPEVERATAEDLVAAAIDEDLRQAYLSAPDAETAYGHLGRMFAESARLERHVVLTAPAALAR